MRWLCLLAAALLLSGCDEGPSVQRRASPPAEGGTDQTAASSTPSDPHAGAGTMSGSPHGMQAPESTPSTEGPEVDAGLVHLTGPKSWVRKQPMSSFVQAEFALPKSEGDDADGRLTVSIAGGSIDDNIARWRNQFGKIEKESREKLDVGGVPVHVVDYTGLYHEQRGMMGPVTDRANYRMLGAIAEVGGQEYFIKSYGPQKTMAAHADEFQQFVKSLKMRSGG